MTPHRAAIALGSNLGDRGANLRTACELLSRVAGVRVEVMSKAIETPAWAPPDAAGSIGGPYLNAAAVVETSLAPRALLEALLRVEKALGRRRDPANRWGPRTIDLDLILYDQEVIDEPGLVVPHPRLHERRFVLAPLSTIAPDWVVGGAGGGRKVSQLLGMLPTG